MKSNTININHKEEKNSLYKCHFCQQTIDVYEIEKHFSTFHKFRSYAESEYVCEFCDDFGEFHSQTELFHHIQNAHNLVNDKEIQPTAIANVETLEEGKSRFLQLIVNFNSQEDVFNLLQWIKYNDTNIFMSNHKEIENEDYDTNTFMTNHHEIENEVLVVENVSKTTEDNDGTTSHEDINNPDSNSVTDLDQESDEILIQRGTNIFMTKHQGIENQLPFVEDNIRLTTEENFEDILQQDKDNAHSNSIDFDEGTGVILTSTEIIHSQENSDDEIFEGDSNNITTSVTSGHALEQHIKTIHDDGNEDHKCESCGKSFSRVDSLKRHIHIVHERHKDYKCESCGKIFYNANNLNRHIHTVHEGRKDYKCESCSKSFSGSEYLKKHILITHKGHKDYKCKSCGEYFSDASNLKRHIRTVHEGHKYYECKHCGKSFSAAGSLKKHIHTIHQGHRDYKCESCGKSFPRADKLKNHIHRVHEGHKDYKCESCGKSFSQAGNLRVHIHNIHEGHKDYKCKSCSKSFSVAATLKKHIHTFHEGHKDYKCESCGKFFSYSQYLKIHIRTVHEGHKDYKCKSCSKSFSQIGTLKTHIHTVHEGHKDHKCKACDKSFFHAISLKKHTQTVHSQIS